MTKAATRKGRGAAEEKKAASAGSSLNPRQLRFIDEYLVDMNATQAAVRAGYAKRRASEMGYENLRKPQIAQAIEAKRKELAANSAITRERFLREIEPPGTTRDPTP